MWVYFDDNGIIKCVSPVQDDENLPQGLIKHQFPINQVMHLIDGTGSLSKYIVKPDLEKKSGYIISKRQETQNVTLKMNRFVTQLSSTTPAQIQVQVTSDKLIFTMCDELKQELSSERTYRGHKILPFYITARNNPYVLLEEILIPTDCLIHDAYYIHKLQNNIDPCETSIYAKQIFDSYNVTC